jgi:hypothetical protein
MSVNILKYLIDDMTQKAVASFGTNTVEINFFGPGVMVKLAGRIFCATETTSRDTTVRSTDPSSGE